MSNTYQTVGEKNYTLKVVRVNDLIELPGLDNLRGVPVDGYLALVSKDTEVGSLMVVFPAECQLLPEFAAEKNLYRKAEMNSDPTQTGYLEHHGRIRAIKLRGHVSSCLLLPAWLPDMEEGLLFDTINGKTISWKYEPPVKSNPAASSAQRKAWKRVDVKFLPEHPDTAQYLREQDSIPDYARFVVTQKLHGTSLRVGHTIVKRKLTWKDKLAAWFGVPVRETEYAHVCGSRKVIKDPENPNQNHYYDVDLWSSEGMKYATLLPEGVVIYGELIGYVPGTTKPIQKGYTYNVPVGEADFYVYRVTVVTEDAHQYDLSDEAMRNFCALRGLRVVPKLWEGTKSDFRPETWVNRDFHGEGRVENAVPLAKESPCDEGVVIRIEGVNPSMYKVKSPLFFAYESEQLDSGDEVLS